LCSLEGHFDSQFYNFFKCYRTFGIFINTHFDHFFLISLTFRNSALDIPLVSGPKPVWESSSSLHGISQTTQRHTRPNETRTKLAIVRWAAYAHNKIKIVPLPAPSCLRKIIGKIYLSLSNLTGWALGTVSECFVFAPSRSLGGTCDEWNCWNSSCGT
jgi:hypothetical protein